MSSVFVNQERDPMLTHPRAGVFIEAAFKSDETSGTPRIPTRTWKELAGQFGLDTGEAAALAYLAMHRVQEYREEIEAIL